MKIVYLHQYFVTPEMSGGTRSYEWASRLAARGHDVHVVTSLTTSGPPPDSSTHAGFQVHWISVPYDNSMSTRRRLMAFLQFALRASRRARALDPDLVFATSTPLTIVLPALVAMWRRSVPLVFEVRDLWPKIPIAMGALRNPVARAVAEELERVAYRNATRVVALSAEMAQGVRDAGYPGSAVSLVPNAADVDLFRRAGVSDQARRFRRGHAWLRDRPLVLYAGTLGRVNDVSSLTAIAASMLQLDGDVRFLVVGDGAERDAVCDEARRLGVLGTNFFMLPRVSKDFVPVLYNAATITTSLVADIPALFGNSANKVFDSFAAERPVALNADGSLGEILKTTGAGLVLSRKPEAAARQLADFLADEARQAEARAASSELGSVTFSRDILFADLERVIHEAFVEGRVKRRLARRT
jgi:glycosyltransferase involved in cell wall biosynthesis